MCSTAKVCGWVSASTTNTASSPSLEVRRATRHRLGGRGALVEQRGVGHVERRQVAHHRLEVQERLETTLGDLRLVRRVRGVPGRVLEDVPADHRRGDRVVVAESDHRRHDAVPPGQRAQRVERLGFGSARRQRQGSGVADRGPARRDRRARRAIPSPGRRASWPGRLPPARCGGSRTAPRRSAASRGRSVLRSMGCSGRGRRWWSPPPLSWHLRASPTRGFHRRWTGSAEAPDRFPETPRPCGSWA